MGRSCEGFRGDARGDPDVDSGGDPGWIWGLMRGSPGKLRRELRERGYTEGNPGGGPRSAVEADPGRSRARRERPKNQEDAQ